MNEPAKLTGEDLKLALTARHVFNAVEVTIHVCPKCAFALQGAQAGVYHSCDAWILARDEVTGAYYRAYCQCPCDS